MANSPERVALRDSPAGPTDLIGARVGPYRIQELLGVGGMGSVYLGVDEALDRPAAIKVLSRVDAGSVARFLTEARRQARLDHPNIVSVYGAGSDVIDGQAVHYIALKHIEGSSLYQLVREHGPLDPEHATQLILDAARGLYYVHSEGFVHRDVKPTNILVDLGDRALIADFGIARDGGVDSRPAEFIGTWNYASPEQLALRTVDARTDIYSLGLTWLFALIGRDPIEEARADDEEPPIDPAFPGALRDTLQRMLARDPERRPASMLHCIERVEATLDRLRSPTQAPHAHATDATPRRPHHFARKTLRVLALLSAAAFVGPGSAYLASHSGRGPVVYRTALAVEPPATEEPPASAATSAASAALAEIDRAARALWESLDATEAMLAARTITAGTALDPHQAGESVASLQQLRDIVTVRLGTLDRQAQAAMDPQARRRLDLLAQSSAPRLAAILGHQEDGPIEIGPGLRVCFGRHLVANVEYFAFLLMSAPEALQPIERFTPGGADAWVEFAPPRSFRRPRFDRAFDPVVALHRTGMELFAASLQRRLPTYEEWNQAIYPSLRHEPASGATPRVLEWVLWDGEPYLAFAMNGLPRFRERSSVKREQEGFRLIRDVP